MRYPVDKLDIEKNCAHFYYLSFKKPTSSNSALAKSVDQQHLQCFFSRCSFTPGPRLMRVHLVRNSTIAKFEKSPNIHLMRHIIHLVRIFALSD